MLENLFALAAMVVLTTLMLVCAVAAVVHGSALLGGIYLAAAVFLGLPLLVAFREKR
jgi:hypothetical protein